MSILSQNNEITESILDKHGFCRGVTDFNALDNRLYIMQNKFYKPTEIKVKTLDFDSRDYTFLARSVFEYDPKNKDLKLHCKDMIFNRPTIYQKQVEDEVDLISAMHQAESNIYYPL
jgi:hypothetical protein